MSFFSWDIALFSWLHALAGNSVFFDALTIFLATYLIYFLMGAIAFVAIFWYVRHPGEWKHPLLFVIAVYGSAFIARIVVVESLRVLVDRMRPFEVLPAVYQLVAHTAGKSFPSGHASFFFAAASALMVYHKKAGIAFLCAAFLTSLARVIAGVHWPSDIFAGAIVGILTAWIIRKILQIRTFTGAKSW